MPNPRTNGLLKFLSQSDPDGSQQLPSLKELSERLDMSIPRLREQLEVAKAFGFVEVRPRTGIRRLPFSFYPPVYQSLLYAMGQDPHYFDHFSDLRNHIEAAYWEEAVEKLTPDDLDELDDLLDCAWKKLLDQPVLIPHMEHRELHMALFGRLENPFVVGMLEAYWDAYEAVGLNLYTDYDYLKKVWTYHTAMIEAIRNKDFKAGYLALIEHKELLRHRIGGITTSDTPLTA